MRFCIPGCYFCPFEQKSRAAAFRNSPVVIGIGSYLKIEKIFWKNALIFARSFWNQLRDS